MQTFPTVTNTFHLNGVMYEEKATYSEKTPRSVINVTISKPDKALDNFIIITPPIPLRPWYSVMDSSWKLRSTASTYVSARSCAVELLHEAHLDKQQAHKLVEGSTAHLRNHFPLPLSEEGVWKEIETRHWKLTQSKYTAAITYFAKEDYYYLKVYSPEGLLADRKFYLLRNAKVNAEKIVRKAIEEDGRKAKKAITFHWKKVTHRLYYVKHEINSITYNGSVLAEADVEHKQPFNATLRVNEALVLNKNYITAVEARRAVEEAIKNHLLAKKKPEKDSHVTQLAEAMK